MYKFLSKNGQLLAFVLGLVITAIFMFSVFSGLDTFNALAEDQRGTTDIFNFGLYAAAGLTAFAAFAAVVASLFQTLSNPKGALKGLIGVAAIAGLYFVGQSFAGADSSGVTRVIKEFAVTPGQSGWIDGAIGGGLALLGIALAVFAISELLNFFK